MNKIQNVKIIDQGKGLVQTKDTGLTLGRDLKGSVLSEIGNMEKEGAEIKLRNWIIDSEGKITDSTGRLVKTKQTSEDIGNLFVKDGVKTLGATSVKGSGAAENAGSGLNWLLKAGRFGPVAYAFS